MTIVCVRRDFLEEAHDEGFKQAEAEEAEKRAEVEHAADRGDEFSKNI